MIVWNTMSIAQKMSRDNDCREEENDSINMGKYLGIRVFSNSDI